MKKKFLSLALALCMVLSLLPLTALAAPAAENGWTAPGTVSDTGTMAYRYNGNNFDIHGTFDGNWKQVTYGDGGFNTVVSGTDKNVREAIRTPGTPISLGAGDAGGAGLDGYDAVTLQVLLDFALEGGAVKITYVLKNAGGVDKTVSFGSGADVQIGDDDSAVIAKLENGNGFSMVSDEDTDKNGTGDFARFNFFAKGVAGFVTDVDSFWFGSYSGGSWRNNYYENVVENSFSGGDSAMSYSWQDEVIPGNSTREYSILMGIGDKDSVNIVSGAKVDDYDESNPPATFTITVDPCDPAKHYALMVKDGNTWSVAPNTMPQAFGTITNVPGVITDLGSGWYSNNADKDQKIRFHNVLPGKIYRVDEREAITENTSDGIDRLPYQDIAVGSLTANTVADGTYALYTSTDSGVTWTVSAPTEVVDQAATEITSTDNWYKNSAVTGGTLTFTYSATPGNLYKIGESASHDNGVATKSVSVATPVGSEYSLWQGSTQITTVPSTTGTDAILGTGSAAGWFTNTATADGAFEWSELAADKEYTVKSRVVTEPLTKVSVTFTAAAGKEYALHKKVGEIWTIISDIDPTGTTLVEDGSTGWWSAEDSTPLTWSELGADSLYKIQERTAAVSGGEVGEPSDAAVTSVISAASTAGNDYALYSFDGASWTIVDDTPPVGVSDPTDGWYTTTEPNISWNSPGTGLTYQIKERPTDGSNADLSTVKVDVSVAEGYDYAVQSGGAVVTGAGVADTNSTSVDPTEANGAWYAGAADEIYQWTITTNTDAVYTVLKRGEYDAKSSLSVAVEGTRSYAVYVKDTAGVYVPTTIAATGTGAAQKGGAGWYTAGAGAILTFSNLDPTLNYQINATTVKEMDSLLPPTDPDAPPDGVDGDNSRPSREVYTETANNVATEYAKIIVANTSDKYEYALAEVITNANGGKTYSRGVYAAGGSDIVYPKLDAQKTYVIYTRLIVVGATAYPRRSAELGPVVSSGDYISPTISIPVNGGDATVKTEVTTSGSNVTVKEPTTADLEKVIAAATREGKPVELDLSALNDTLTSVILPANTIAALGKSIADETGCAGLTIILPNGNSVTFDRAATAAICAAAGGKTLTLSIDERAAAKPTVEENALLGGWTTMNIFDLTLKDANGKVVGDFVGGTAAVTLLSIKMLGELTDYTLFHKVADGLIPQTFTPTATKTEGVYDLTVPTTGWSSYILAYRENKNPFTDVIEGKYYYDAVLWAVEKGITSGMTETTFAPSGICDRAQAVTFLWRAMGSPEPTNTHCPFLDVAPDAYYYQAILWAVEKGVTVGTSATTFSPNLTIDRSQAVTLLHRMAGKPVSTGTNTFSDVPENAYYANAVLWAVENGITQGTGQDSFSPLAQCSRGQMVTFLYRWHLDLPTAP